MVVPGASDTSSKTRGSFKRASDKNFFGILLGMVIEDTTEHRCHVKRDAFVFAGPSIELVW